MFVFKEWPLINVYDLPCWKQDSFCLSKKYPSWHFCKITPIILIKKKTTINDAIDTTTETLFLCVIVTEHFFINTKGN